VALFDYTVAPGQNALRLDVLLAEQSVVGSRNQAQKLIAAGAVKVNGQIALSKSQLLCSDDQISFEVKPLRPLHLEGEEIPLDIVYEDQWLIVLDKPAGMVVHPAPGSEHGTLVNALIWRYGYEHLAQVQGEDRPGIVHRLDKDTSGLMLAAKDSQVGLALQEDIRYKRVDRRYLALVHGNIAPETGQIDAPLIKNPSHRQFMKVGEGAGMRTAVTTFKVLARYGAGQFDDGYTLIECKLFSGRMHQIRVHLDYIKHPVVGDPFYGQQNKSGNKLKAWQRQQMGLKRQFLHSHSLTFKHPRSDVEMHFESKLPPELQAIIDKLKPRLL
jgi:23S rRNA pseudouridine1911/1915/1917 synthase